MPPPLPVTRRPDWLRPRLYSPGSARPPEPRRSPGEWASGSVRVSTRAQFLLVEDVALGGAHPGLPVKQGRSRDAGGVHAEANLLHATAVELTECVPEQREPESHASPRTPDAHHIHLSAAAHDLAEAHAGDPTPALRHEPKVVVKALDAGEP